MKPVDQRIIDPGKGDCMTAALASLLELPYEQVPYFLGYGQETWFVEFCKFLKSQGYEFMGGYSTNEPPLLLGPELLARSKGLNGLYMASGPSPRFKCSHAVVIDSDGKLVHDPHPSHEGVPSINYVYMIEKADA